MTITGAAELTYLQKSQQRLQLDNSGKLYIRIDEGRNGTGQEAKIVVTFSLTIRNDSQINGLQSNLQSHVMRFEL